MSKNCIATFHSTYSVLKAERILKAQKLEIDAVSVPRHISSDCGIGIRFDCGDKSLLQDMLSNERLEISGIYEE